jgi:undecaprenyl-diphosphatase
MHQVVIIVAKYFIVLSALITFWVYVEQPKEKKKEFIIVGAIGGLLALLFAHIGSHFFYNPRPFVVGHFTPYFSHGNDNGFPSDHTLLASFMMYLSYHYSKKFGVTLFVLAALIGLARVQAGVHHLIDIIGSFVFAGLGFALALYINKKFFAKSSKKAKTAPIHE